MTREDWIRTHEFLRPLADLHARVEAAIAVAAPPPPATPDWDAYADDFVAGVPLLASPNAAVDMAGVDRAAAAVVAAVDDLASGDEGFAHAVRCLTRTIALAPVRLALEVWRDDERWLRTYCPTCGSDPAMAQLAGVDPGRVRLLSCGVCRTRWRFGRTTCPFCGVQAHRLASLDIDGEGGLRIDYCPDCLAYLKTYNGQGDESVLLADWTSLHLDLAARDRGWRRAAMSLYDLAAPPTPVYRSGSGKPEGTPDNGVATC